MLHFPKGTAQSLQHNAYAVFVIQWCGILNNIQMQSLFQILKNYCTFFLILSLMNIEYRKEIYRMYRNYRSILLAYHQMPVKSQRASVKFQTLTFLKVNTNFISFTFFILFSLLSPIHPKCSSLELTHILQPFRCTNKNIALSKKCFRVKSS